MLREGQAASGLLWFLLRHLDRDGRGWVDRAEAYKAFAGRTGPLQFCSRRHLARLLGEGEGLFWTAEKERIWIRGQARVAAALGIERLTGRPVAVPLGIFLGRNGTLKANFYTAFHSSRSGEREYGPPIARETITAVTGVPRHTQRHYERRVGVLRRPNIALSLAQPAAPFESPTCSRVQKKGYGERRVGAAACRCFFRTRPQPGRPGAGDGQL